MLAKAGVAAIATGTHANAVGCVYEKGWVRQTYLALEIRGSDAAIPRFFSTLHSVLELVFVFFRNVGRSVTFGEAVCAITCKWKVSRCGCLDKVGWCRSFEKKVRE